jgi:hypothetical protein
MDRFILNLKYYIKKNKLIYLITLKLIHLIKIILNLENRTSLLHRINKKIILLQEINKLKRGLFKEINIIYDCNTSPFTLGDFFNVAMGARYFQLKGYKVNFFLIKYDFDKVYLNRNKHRINFFYLEFEKILSSLLKKNFTYQKKNWEIFKKINLDKSFTLFNDRVLKRKYTYGFYFNLINLLFKDEKKLFINKYLLNKKNLKKLYRTKLPKKNFITLHCRFNPLQIHKKNSRNLKKNEFLKIVKLLKRKFKTYELVVISDKVGCKYFTQISKDHKLDISYSKDYTKSFIEDGALILNSKYYFQVWGGGMCVFTYYSKLPSLRCTTTLHNELSFTKNQLALWHTEKNFLIENDNRDYKEFIKKLNYIDV